ncbi:MAG: Cof-type HAD-IIB family hydrolase [Clostridiales bacterium]|jgi:Cof subfamily protein (haloacid dehalogenase superfamily)|nr:Cof-type HAD-IIB family hydrolase [Clostridiales bacterium]
MYKLLAMDLDGTLLNDNGEFPAKNKLAIKEAIESGVKACVCSGRSYMSLLRFERELGLDCEPNYGVCFNGSIVYKTWNRDIILDRRVRNETAVSIARRLKRFDGDVVMYVKDMLFIEEETARLKDYVNRSRVIATVVKSFDDIKDDVSKVLLKSEPESLRTAAEYMGEVTKGECNQFFTEPTLLEYTALDATKGAALAFLAERVGIGMNEVIAAGDHNNDVSMIEAAGMGVAVANAIPAAKRAAKYITKADNNDGAIYEIVDRFIKKL